MKYSNVMDQIPIPPLSEALKNRCSEEVAQAEMEYHSKISQVCDHAIAKEIYILLITGPSSSGKTTTAKKITAELRARGHKVERISLDNFYKNVEDLPRWSDGYQNYESIEGLDVGSFESIVKQLLREGHASLPLFDFTTGRRGEKVHELICDPQTFLIIEGIHALNPLIFRSLQGYANMKLYISVHSDFVDAPGQVCMGARELRLVRRMIRDFYYRDTPAEDTFKMWEYVLRGEELYIRPFRKYADFHLNSTHSYEPYLYHEEMVRMLKECPADSPFRALIVRLLEASSHFFHIPSELIPASSLIQEFLKPKSWK